MTSFTIFYLDAEFVNVDGTDVSNRMSSMDRQGKFLTLWMSETTETCLSPSPSTVISDVTSDTDTISDIYLTLLHSTHKTNSPTQRYKQKTTSSSNRSLKQIQPYTTA
jgi:hypothetical protein